MKKITSLFEFIVKIIIVVMLAMATIIGLVLLELSFIAFFTWPIAVTILINVDPFFGVMTSMIMCVIFIVVFGKWKD